MKRLVLAGLGALAVATIVSAAHAADLPRRHAMPAKVPSYEAPYYNWTGFYIGINGGGGWGKSDWSNNYGSSDAKPSGGLVGGTLGYNYQMGQVVFGLEGDGDWSDIRGSTDGAGCPSSSCETRNSWLATARGRIGYAFDRVMPYVTGGAAFGDIRMTPAGYGTTTSTKTGWTVGGGAEFAIAGPWTAKVEYLYVDLGKGSCGVAQCGIPTDVSYTANLVRAGINFRF